MRGIWTSIIKLDSKIPFADQDWHAIHLPKQLTGYLESEQGFIKVRIVVSRKYVISDPCITHRFMGIEEGAGIRHVL